MNCSRKFVRCELCPIRSYFSWQILFIFMLIDNGIIYYRFWTVSKIKRYGYWQLFYLIVFNWIRRRDSWKNNLRVYVTKIYMYIDATKQGSNLKNLALKFNLATMKIKKCYSISRRKISKLCIRISRKRNNKNIPNSL